MSTAQLTTPGREIEISESSGNVKRRPVTNRALNRAAKELNLVQVKASGLLGISTIGRFLDQLGMLHYGNGRLLASAEMITEAARLCAEFAVVPNLDHETRQGYLELQLRFIQALDANIASQLELNNASAFRPASSPSGPNLPAKSFLPGAQLSPIQINVNTGTTTAEKKEEPCPSQS